LYHYNIRPYDKFTFIEEMAPNHNLCLNKFYVYDHHLLLLTRDFQPQVAHLSVDDFLAVVNTWELLGDGAQQQQQKQNQGEELSWMAFYNRGFYSGASQPHKHIQLVPSHTLSTTTNSSDNKVQLNFPLIPVLDKHVEEQKQEVPEYNFKHAFGSLKQCKPNENEYNGDKLEYNKAYAKNLHAKYQELLQQVGLLQEEFEHDEQVQGSETFINVICEDKATYEAMAMNSSNENNSNNNKFEKHRLSLSMTRYPSYNLLFTRNWMVIVPRKLENYQNISCNSLCFAFSFFARHDVDLAVLNKLGCSNLLANITFEKK